MAAAAAVAVEGICHDHEPDAGSLEQTQPSAITTLTGGIHTKVLVIVTRQNHVSTCINGIWLERNRCI